MEYISSDLYNTLPLLHFRYILHTTLLYTLPSIYMDSWYIYITCIIFRLGNQLYYAVSYRSRIHILLWGTLNIVTYIMLNLISVFYSLPMIPSYCVLSIYDEYLMWLYIRYLYPYLPFWTCMQDDTPYVGLLRNIACTYVKFIIGKARIWYKKVFCSARVICRFFHTFWFICPEKKSLSAGRREIFWTRIARRWFRKIFRKLMTQTTFLNFLEAPAPPWKKQMNGAQAVFPWIIIFAIALPVTKYTKGLLVTLRKSWISIQYNILLSS